MKTALHYAAKSFDASVVDPLLGNGADVDAKDSEGKTALHLAVAGGRRALADRLLQSADIEVFDKNHRTPLHLAVANCREEMIKALANKNVNFNAKNKEGNTALQMAAFYGNLAVTECLLDSGADIAAPGKDGMVALHAAALKPNLMVLEALARRNPDLNLIDDLGNCLMHYMTASNSYLRGAIKYMVLRGVDPHRQNKEGMTALPVAFSHTVLRIGSTGCWRETRHSGCLRKDSPYIMRRRRKVR
ncbi:hypothetical protein AJ79_01528 [Helicocarpus griseus UAMH5409]|uniref:Uncharacterized protein n=1 Tax=Helicocarpus griseus UAMH5409 TaxID=1447875 RepID=A0A2B7XYK8_9EURO|nr:hypothetical protein AJ79_01528 [Helicocarpus griseus UAMH5409]